VRKGEATGEPTEGFKESSSRAGISKGRPPCGGARATLCPGSWTPCPWRCSPCTRNTPIQTPSLRQSVSLVFPCGHKASFACLCSLPSVCHWRRSRLCLLPLDGPVGFARHRCPTSSRAHPPYLKTLRLYPVDAAAQFRLCLGLSNDSLVPLIWLLRLHPALRH